MKINEYRMSMAAKITKTVLVCLGERKREVSFEFSSDNIEDSEVKALLTQLGEVFSDVLSADKIRLDQLVLQYKNEDWNGEFIDAMGPICNKSVIRAVVCQDVASRSGLVKSVSL